MSRVLRSNDPEELALCELHILYADYAMDEVKDDGWEPDLEDEPYE